MILALQVPTTLPLTISGLLLIYFVQFGGDIPMVFTSREESRQYRFFMGMCLLIGIFLLFAPIWVPHG